MCMERDLGPGATVDRSQLFTLECAREPLSAHEQAEAALQEGCVGSWSSYVSGCCPRALAVWDSGVGEMHQVGWRRFQV